MADALLLGRYALLNELGRGASGVVHRARDVRLDRLVAVKVLHRSDAGDPALRRLADEALAAAAVDHPGVVPLYDWAQDDEQAVLVMRLVPGTDLATRLRARGRLDPASAADVVAQVGDALDAAHARGLVHRDVKPANVLLEPTGDGDRDRALLTDFGIARLSAGGARSTESGSVVGTAAYMAPEQASDGEVGPPADVYSLACVAFHCFAGQPPFPGSDAQLVASQHVRGTPPPLGDLVPDLPRGVAQAVARGLAKDPAERPSAGGLGRALRQAVHAAGGAVPAAAGGGGDDAATTTALPVAPRAGDGTATTALPTSPRPAARTSGVPPPDAPPPGPAAPAPRRGRPAPSRRPPRRRRPPARRSDDGTRLLVALAGVVLVAVLGGLAISALRGDGGAAEPGPDGAVVTDGLEGDAAGLAAQLPASVFGDCEDYPEALPDGASASLRCDPAAEGVDELLVASFPGRGELDAWWERTVTEVYPDGRCSQGFGVRSTWNGGRLACYLNSNDDAVMRYDYGDRPVQVTAVRDDDDSGALFAWFDGGSGAGVPLL